MTGHSLKEIETLRDNFGKVASHKVFCECGWESKPREQLEKVQLAHHAHVCRMEREGER